MRVRKIVPVLVGAGILLVIGAAQTLPRVMSGFGSPVSHKLEFEVVTTQGIRPLNSTTYRFYEIRGEEKTLLWQKRYGGTHLKHWITDSGVIWLVNSSSHPLERGGLFCLNAANGEELMNGLGTTSFVGDLEFAASQPHTYQHHGERTEVFTTKDKDGAEVSYVLTFPQYPHTPQKFIFPDSANNPVIKGLATGRIHSLAQVQSSSNLPRSLELWSASSTDGALKTEQWLFVLGSQHAESVNREVQRVIPLSTLPTDVVAAPRSLSVWFYFGKGATAEIRDAEGKVLHTTDLMTLGGFPSVEWAQYNLHYRDLRAPKSGEGWRPVAPNDFSMGGMKEIPFDIYDQEGRRFVWTVTYDDQYKPVRIEEKMFEGLAARRPVSGYSGVKAAETNVIDSPSRAYSLRVSRFEPQNEKQRASTSYTFLVNTTNSRGMTEGAEIWASGGYSQVHRSLVSQSGRTVVFTSSEDPDRGTVVIYEPDGRRLVDKNLSALLGTRTDSEAVKKIDFEATQYVQEGSPFSRPYDGFSTQVWPRETLIVKLRDGSERRVVIHTDGKSWSVRVDD